jgi:hypothetical protein
MQEGREEMVTPFHTACTHVNGLFAEVDHAIRLVWIRVVMSYWMRRKMWLSCVTKEKNSGTNSTFCVVKWLRACASKLQTRGAIAVVNFTFPPGLVTSFYHW